MAAVIVDANVLIAARLSRDQNHDRGEAITQAIDQGTHPTAYVLSDVLAEVINNLQARAGHDAVIEISGFSLRQTTKSEFDTGRSLFRRYEPLSLTDAVIVAMMHREDIEYLYSFDDGFDSVSRITRLTTPVNPFEQ
ncbi:type II toxin-antitoxin system VapC family toxin [Halovenus halobia]|uniref:type II toxin-antitoxin system VapC family toxin n=1 Tax=Halovenus halobia TaxID=3396622 RepID=UPI003F57A177